MRLRTIRATGRTDKLRTGSGAVVRFDESLGWLAQAPEPVAEELVGTGAATVPHAHDLATGRFVIRRRAGMGDVLCLVPVVRELLRLGAEVAVACHPRFEPLWNGIAPIADRHMPGWTSVQFDGALERHPGRKDQCAAQCYGDRWNMDVGDARPLLELAPAELQWGRSRAAELRDGGRKLVAVFTQAGWATRRWAGMIGLAKRLAEDGHSVLGLDAAVPTCRRQPKILDVRRLAALVAACDLVVTNDSGPLHLAAAVGTPSVAVFCATSAAGSVGPGYDCRALEPEGLDCWPCWRAGCENPECVRGVDPDDAYEAVTAALE